MCPVSVSHEAWCNIGKYWSKVVCCAAFIIPRKSNCPQLGLSQPQADRDEQHIFCFPSSARPLIKATLQRSHPQQQCRSLVHVSLKE